MGADMAHIDFDQIPEHGDDPQETKAKGPQTDTPTASELQIKKTLSVRFTPEQQALLQSAGKLSGVTPALKMRELALAWAREMVREAQA